MRKTVSIRLDEATLSAAQRRAAAENRTLTNYVETALQRDLGQTEPLPALERVLATLRARKEELRLMGVRHASVFGSLARGDIGPSSDVDIAIDVDPVVVSSLFDQGRLQQVLQEWIGHPVDLARKDRLRGGIAREAAQDGVDAF